MTHVVHTISSTTVVDSSLSVGTVASELMSIDEAYLSTWFVYEYIGKCTQLCTDYVLRLFDDANSLLKLQNAVSAIVEFRLNASLRNFWHAVKCAESLLSGLISHCRLTVRSCVCLMNEWTKCDRDLYLGECFLAFAFLYVGHKIAVNGFNDNLMHVLATVLGQLNDTPHYSKLRGSVFSINTAAKLMKVAANKLHNTVQLIEIELSEAYLYRALKYKDSDSDSIYCLSNVYLAVLYYNTGQYQTAIDHCTVVTRSQDHSQCSSHVVQGELLPKIDDNIDNILGLTVFYQYVLSAALNQQLQTQYVSVFTTEMFAYYLHCRLLSVTQCRQVTQMSLPDVSQRCAEYISEMNELFISDVLVFKSQCSQSAQNVSNMPEWNTVDRSIVSEAELNTSQLVDLLQQSAVENLTIFRQYLARDFGSVATIVTTDFEALYAYKHGDYQRCLQLSTQNVHTLLYGRHMPYVPIYPEFIQLLDDDIVSLTALTLIVNPECRRHSDSACISQLTLSLYLMTQCQLKLRHSVTSLVQTLDYIKVAQTRHGVQFTLDHLTLKLAKCKTTTYLRMMLIHY